MNKITAIIPTYNEAHNIVKAIESIKFADEIIIVDSFSSDKTVELATPISDRILKREYKNSASQKNWAIQKAKHNWVLILDADERINNKLKKEIIKTISQPSEYSGFWIRRNNYFMGKKIRFSGWQGDKVIRLFKKNNCKYENKNVHAEIISDGKIGMLKNKIFHNTFQNKKQYKEKLNRYAKWQALDYEKITNNITLFHTHIKPALRFFKHFVFQLGILDGYTGFIISIYQAKAVRMRYKYLKIYRESKDN